MTHHIAVFDGFGELLTIIAVNNKYQLKIALNDFAYEHFTGCRLQGDISGRDWDSLTKERKMGISILCDITSDYELELKGVNMRDYSDLPQEDV